jgi:hypothetical protein
MYLEKTSRAAVFVMITLLLVGSTALAQPGDGYNLTWWTVDGGGAGAGLPGPYSLGSTVGQADAGTLTGGGYTLAGGFWHSGVALDHYIFLPLVLRNF